MIVSVIDPIVQDCYTSVLAIVNDRYQEEVS